VPDTEAANPCASVVERLFIVKVVASAVVTPTHSSAAKLKIFALIALSLGQDLDKSERF
jgi:hypothetical protein